MKKSILLFAVGLGLLTSCDPIKEDGDFTVTQISADQLLEGAEFAQFSDAECTIPADDGNYIKFNIPNVPSVTIYTLQVDGSEFTLSRGKAGGVMSLVPRRGSDSNQTVYFRYINQEGEDVVATKLFSVYVPGDIPAEMKLLTSNVYGSKTWTWDTESGIINNDNPVDCFWGNMGGPGSGDGSNIAGYLWWGVTDGEQLLDQLGHSVTGKATGEESNAATMVFSDDGLVKCYDKDGNVIRSGSFEIRDWNPNGDWKIGTLHTTEGATLFPYEINAGGRYVTDFEIHKLTTDKLVLAYPDNGVWDGWSEGTYWAFKSNSDASGMLTNFDAKTWTWDTESGIINNDNPVDCFWGNMGGPGSGDGSNIAGYLWWGVTDGEQLLDQLGHSVTGTPVGEESNDATMVFNENGTVTCYDKDGNVIRSGSYEIRDWNPNGDWKIGTLHTTEGATLFPYEINAGGRYVTDFEIHKLTDGKFVLAYPDNGIWDGWSEGTYWAFKVKR